MHHTPGPWRPVKLKNAWGVYDPQGTSIARCGRNADARLIAAAPELLAALQNLVGMAEYFPSELYTQHPSVVEARAAIAQAVGDA